MDEPCGASRNAPIACSLNAAELQTRLRQFHALAACALVRRERTPDGAFFVFREGTGETERTVRELARLEKECCPFFEFAIHVTTNTVRLTVAAPDEARPFVDGLFESIQQ